MEWTDSARFVDTTCSPNERTCQWVSDWTGNPTMGRLADWFIGVPLTVATIIAVGLLATWLLHRAIARVVRRTVEGVLPAKFAPSGLSRIGYRDAGVMERRAQRVQAMGSLLSSAVTGIVFTIVVVMILSALGIDVAPVLAGAGVVGVALGFGSQSLVKDFVSGIFMIFEDQYGVGDMVDVGEATGTVEAVSLRVTRLRDVNGTVWYVRNGEILRVGNMSQNWASLNLDVPVSHDADLARVREILAEVTDQMSHESEFADLIMEPPEILGVQSIEPDAVRVRVRLKTAPMEQWRVARALREQIKARFDAEGIEMPAAHVMQWQRREDGTTSPGPRPS